MSIRAALIASFTATALAVPLATDPNVGSSPKWRSVGLAPLHSAERPINSSYIVVLKDEYAHPSLLQNHLNFHAQEASLLGGLIDDVAAGVKHVFEAHFTGYAGAFSEQTVEKLRAMPEVDYVEQDSVVTTVETQRSAPWGLARISHRPRLTFSTFSKYEYNPHGGEGVDVYVIDTGIYIHHVEFEGRAVWGKTIPVNDVDEDNNGHGTHCAGTIASRKYGVAKAAKVIAVKVLGSNGSGSMSDVVAGVEYASKEAAQKAAAAEAEFRATGKTSHKGSVANMSLGGGKSLTLDRAVNAAVANGLHFAVAAGNDNKDACNYSPAAAADAVTVGASTLGDVRASFSNHGKCVDVFAPGLNILSTYKSGPTAVATMSGTSMASPHTAGIIAYLLSIYPSKEFNPVIEDDSLLSTIPSQATFSLPNIYDTVHSILPRWMSSFLPSPALVADAAPIPMPKTLTPMQMKKALLDLSTSDVLEDLPIGTPNLLIFNNATTA